MVSLGLHGAVAAVLLAAIAPAARPPGEPIWIDLMTDAPESETEARRATAPAAAPVPSRKARPPAATSVEAPSETPVVESTAPETPSDSSAAPPQADGSQSAATETENAAPVPIAATDGDVAIAASDATAVPSGVDLAGFLDEVRRRLDAAKQYPAAARRSGMEGTTEVQFRLRSDGAPNEIEVVRSSRSAVLDGAAVETVRRAGPFPPPPAQADMIVRVPLVFQLEEE
jgi:protein TonB